MRKHRLRKIVLITAGIIVALVVLITIFFSPIVKYLVEKYDEKYTGREITLEGCYANPFTGYVSLDGVKIREYQSDSIFISADELNINFEMLKMLSKTYEISNLTLEQPSFIITQEKDRFNFDDLVEKFSSKEDKDTTEGPVHFNILDIHINNGAFVFDEKNTPVNYSLKKINIESTGKAWDIDTIVTKFSFTSGVGDDNFEGNITVNTLTHDYRMAAVVKRFDLDIVEQYMKDISNYGSLRGKLDADVKANGNFKDKQDLDATGIVAINDFHFGKDPTEDFLAFKKLVLDIDQLSPKKNKFFFDSLSLNSPYFKFEQYDELNNISAIFGKEGSNVKEVSGDPEKFNLILEIGRYVREISRNFFSSDYKVSRLAVYNGNLKYNDYSQSEKFSIALQPLSIFADSINKNRDIVKATLRSGIRPYGYMGVTLSINPKDTNDFDLSYDFEKLSAAMLNPYIVSNTSFPLDRGSIELHGNWKVRNGIISSNNNLIVLDPRIGDRQKNKDNSWLPLRVIMFFVRERGNVIDYSVPITGNMKDPKFHLRDVILDVIKNIFVKPPSVGYTSEVRTVENAVEKTFKVKWEFRKAELGSHEELFVKRVAEFLKENPEVSITVTPDEFTEKEKEYILLYEAKKKYYLTRENKTIADYNETDSVAVSKMSAKDSAFVKYLDGILKDKMLFTVQQKSERLVGTAIINKRYSQLLKQREISFRNYFKENGTDSRIKFSPAKKKIPFNGFPYYEISYKGDLPQDLVEAYDRLNELNNEAPRDKYKIKREKSKKN